MERVPVISYSRVRYLMMFAAALVLAVPTSIYLLSTGQAIGILGGCVSLIIAVFCAIGAIRMMRKHGPALAREGDFLVGNELARPLPIAQTTFEIILAESSWYIIIRSGDFKKRLYTGGWKVEGHRFVTKTVAAQVLLELGLTERVPPKSYWLPPS